MTKPHLLNRNVAMGGSLGVLLAVSIWLVTSKAIATIAKAIE